MGAEKLDRLIRQMEAISSDEKLEPIVGRALDEQTDLMATLNREQLLDGERADGSTITPAYKPRTIAAKRRRGQPTNKVTLLWDGDFHHSIKASRKGGVYELDATDKKAPDLREKYGEDIEGLTDEHVAEVSHAAAPQIEVELRKYFGL